jgi:hypothetical protein
MADGKEGELKDFGHGCVNNCLPRSFCGLLCGGDVSCADALRVATSLQLIRDAGAGELYVKSSPADVNPAAGQPAAAAAAAAATDALSRQQMLVEARACHSGAMLGMLSAVGSARVLGISIAVSVQNNPLHPLAAMRWDVLPVPTGGFSSSDASRRLLQSNMSRASHRAPWHLRHTGSAHWQGVGAQAAFSNDIDPKDLLQLLEEVSANLAREIASMVDRDILDTIFAIVADGGRLVPSLRPLFPAVIATPAAAAAAMAVKPAAPAAPSPSPSRAGSAMSVSSSSASASSCTSASSSTSSILRSFARRPARGRKRSGCAHNRMPATKKARTATGSAGAASTDPSPAAGVTPSGHKSHHQVSKWSTLMKNNSDFKRVYGVDVIDISPAACSLHRQTGEIRCAIPGCSASIAAKKFSIAAHLDTMHSDVANVRAQASQQPTLEAVGAIPRAALTASESQFKMGCMAATELFAAGLSARQVEMVRQRALPLLLAARTVPVAQTLLKEGGVLDQETAALTAHLIRTLDGIPVVLYVDGSDTDYSSGKKIIHVVADSIMLDAPMLLEVRLEDEASCDTEYYAKLLPEVIEKYHIDRANVVGVATDNTAVMPAGVRAAGLQHLPCVTHVMDLMLEAIAKELGFRELLGWREFVSKSAARRKQMKSAGLDVACCRGEFDYFNIPCCWTMRHPVFAPRHPHHVVPAHKFGFALGWLKELSTRWEDYAAFLKSCPAPKKPSAKDADEKAFEEQLYTNYQALRLNMGDGKDGAFARVAVLVGWDLCLPAVRLLDATLKDIRSLPMDFWTHFDSWTTALRSFHGDATERVRGLATGVQIDADTLRQVAVNVTRGIAGAFDKTVRHLAEDALCLDANGNAAVARAKLEIYQRRDCWNVGKPDTMPAPDASDFGAWVKRATGQPATTAFTIAYSHFWGSVTGGYLKKLLPPPRPPEPLSEKEAIAYANEYAAALVRLWRAAAADKDTAIVGKAALRALSIPISQAVVERSFSVLSNREIDNRLHAGDRYVVNMMMLAFNRPHYAVVSTQQAAVLGVVLPRPS